MKWAYYNDTDPYVCQWVRNLINAGLVMDGEVDERDIRDVYPDDLRGFIRVHMFCGIAGWDRALRLADWPADRPVWTGSCPCQSFSTAGAGRGFADERHLWPFWHHLIAQQRPPTVLGEQVASKDGLAWFDLVQADLEGEDYAVGSADLCAAGAGAPHIRQRLWFVAKSAGVEGRLSEHAGWSEGTQTGGNGEARDMAHTECDTGVSGRPSGQSRQSNGAQAERAPVEPGRCSGPGLLANGLGQGLEISGLEPTWRQREAAQRGGPAGNMEHALLDGRQQRWSEPGERSTERGRSEGFVGDFARDGQWQSRLGYPSDGWESKAGGSGAWSDAEWIPCIDGKWRPAQPVAQQLAYGLSFCLEQLRSEQKTKVIDAATSTGIGREALRALQQGHDTSALWQALGRRIGFSEATVLFACLCEHERKLGEVVNSAAASGEQKSETELRKMWNDASAATCSSPGFELPEQRAEEFANTLSEMSQADASFAEILMGLREFTGFPLASKVPQRVAKLRALGNAIVPQVAAEFIKAALG